MSKIKPLSTAELLALAILRQDESAIKPLLDYLTEQESKGIKIPPINYIPINVDNIRVVLFFPMDCEIDRESCNATIKDWLANPGTHLALQGCLRMEIYDIKEYKEDRE